MAQQINLYNPALRKQREWLTLGNVALLVLVMAVLLAGVGGVLRSQAAIGRASAQALEARLATVRVEVAQQAARAGAASGSDPSGRELVELKEQLAMRREVLNALQGGAGLEALQGQSTVGFADYLQALARQTVNGLWLTGFSVGTGGQGIEVRGRMLVVDRLPEYIKRLNGEAVFKGRKFESLNIARSDRTSPPSVGSPYAAFVLTAVTAGSESKNKEPAK